MNLPPSRFVHLGGGVMLEVRADVEGDRLVVRVVRFAGGHGSPTLVLELRAHHAVELGSALQRLGTVDRRG